MTLCCSSCSEPYRREPERFVCPSCGAVLYLETVGNRLVTWLGALEIAPEQKRTFETELRKLAHSEAA